MVPVAIALFVSSPSIHILLIFEDSGIYTPPLAPHLIFIGSFSRNIFLRALLGATYSNFSRLWTQIKAFVTSCLVLSFFIYSAIHMLFGVKNSFMG